MMKKLLCALFAVGAMALTSGVKAEEWQDPEQDCGQEVQQDCGQEQEPNQEQDGAGQEVSQDQEPEQEPEQDN